MAYYRTTDRSDRAKALVAVLLVHLALGAMILSGLDVRTVSQAVEQLSTFDIAEAPPPPRTQPPPATASGESSAPQDEAAPANIESTSTPIVAPEPEISLPIPLPMAAEQRGQGADPTAGASNTPGSGTGAGGEGSGSGGGGSGGTGAGTGDGGSAARLVRNLTNRDYRGLAGGRIPAGRAAVRIHVTPQGRARDCQIAQSSGDPRVDRGICELVTRRLRFQPARDAVGRAIPTEVTYIANWRP